MRPDSDSGSVKGRVLCIPHSRAAYHEISEKPVLCMPFPMIKDEENLKFHIIKYMKT